MHLEHVGCTASAVLKLFSGQSLVSNCRDQLRCFKVSKLEDGDAAEASPSESHPALH